MTSRSKSKKRHTAARGVRWTLAFSQDTACSVCGLVYRDFRTGLTFGDVRREFWKQTDDRTQWHPARRHTVLGRWRQIKLSMFEQHLGECAEDPPPF